MGLTIGAESGDDGRCRVGDCCRCTLSSPRRQRVGVLVQLQRFARSDSAEHGVVKVVERLVQRLRLDETPMGTHSHPDAASLMPGTLSWEEVADGMVEHLAQETSPRMRA